MPIPDKLQRFKSILTLQGKPNHTTYEHSRSLTWQPFKSSQPKSSPLHPYSRACPHLIAHGCEPAAFGLTVLLALMRGGLPVQSTAVPTRRYCRLCRFTEPINKACD